MIKQKCQLPYFDLLLTLLDNNHPEIALAFGQHVHWGYWPKPELAVNSSEDFSCAVKQMTREVYSMASVINGQSILDVGCGFGGTISSLNEEFCKLNLVGLNIDQRQLKRAKHDVTAQNGNTIRFISGNTSNLPFPNKSFDIILVVEAIFHFPNRRHFFSRGLSGVKTPWEIDIIRFCPCKLDITFCVVQINIL